MISADSTHDLFHLGKAIILCEAIKSNTKQNVDRYRTNFFNPLRFKKNPKAESSSTEGVERNAQEHATIAKHDKDGKYYCSMSINSAMGS